MSFVWIFTAYTHLWHKLLQILFCFECVLYSHYEQVKKWLKLSLGGEWNEAKKIKVSPRSKIFYA